MADQKSLATLPTENPGEKVTPVRVTPSREEIARKWDIKVEDVPEMPSYEKVQGLLANLEQEVGDRVGEARRKFFAERLRQFSLAEATDKAQELAQAGVQKAKEMTPEALGIALKQGTETLKAVGLESGTKVIESAAQIVNSNGDMNQISGGWNGIKHATESVGTALKTMMKTISEVIMSLPIIGDLLRWLIDGFKWVMGIQSEKKEEKKEEKKPDEKKGESTVEPPKDKLKEDPETVRVKFGERLWEKYVKTGWIHDPAGQKQAFLDTYKQYSDEFVKVFDEIQKKVSGKEEWNAFDVLVKYPLLATKFMLALIAKGVISKKALGVYIYDSARASFGLYLKAPFTLISNGPTSALQSFGLVDASNISKLNDVEKQALITTLSHTMAPQLYLAGKLSSSLAKVGLLGMYWDQGTGITKAHAAINNVFGDLQKGASHIDDIVSMLGNNETTNSLKQYTESVRGIADEAKLKALVAETYRAGEKSGKSASQIAALIEDGAKSANLKNTQSLSTLLSDLRTTSGVDMARSKAIKFLNEGAETLPWWHKTVGSVRNSLTHFSTSEANLKYFLDDANGMLKRYGESLSAVVRNQHTPVISLLQKSRLGLTEAELINAIERGHLPVKAANATDAKGILQQLIKGIPKGFEHLFAGVTIWLTIEHVSQQKTTEEKALTALYDVAAMWPVVGGVMLLHEGFTMEGGVPVKAGYIAGGGIVTALGVRELLNMTAEYGKAGGLLRAVSQPAIMTYEAVASTIRGVQYARQIARFGPRGIAGVVGLGREATLMGRIRPAGFLAFGALLTYLVASQVFEKETTNIMKQAGLIKDDGSAETDPMALKDAWVKVPEFKKDDILKTILGSYGSDLMTIDYNTSKNSVIIHTPKHVEGLPIPYETFGNIRSYFSSLGLPEPTINLTEGATIAVREYISKLTDISPEKQKELLVMFGIN